MEDNLDKSSTSQHPEERGNVSTSTSYGTLSPFPWRDEVSSTDEWHAYARITELVLCSCKGRKSKNSVSPKDTPEEGAGDDPGERESIRMRHSLFPHVSPYVQFHSYNCKCPKLDPRISRLLKWKLTQSTPRVVTRVLLNSGFKLITGSEDWSGAWNLSLGDASGFKQLKSFQKVNSFPGSFHLGNKDHLWMHLYHMRAKFGAKEFGFVPQTYVLPRDLRKFEGVWQKSVGSTWIVKPPCSGRGQGIKIIDQWWEIPKWHSVIVQRYISRPKLIRGFKFDLRVYVLLTSVNPTRIYVYTEGLVRFASVKYVTDPSNLSDRCMHLTNTSVNRQSPNYIVDESADSCRGHKWSFRSLWSYLQGEGVDVELLWSRVKDIVVKTVLATEADMNSCILANVSCGYTCYELYGFDVLLDEDCQPWLLEVNVLPSLQVESGLDLAVKGPLVRNVLNMAGFQIPNNLSLFEERKLAKKFRNCMRQDYRMYTSNLSIREKVKHNEYIAMKSREQYLGSILKDLTRDDLRHLVRYEDELTQVGRFEKVFPTNESHIYLRFFETPRYYNRLLDAWESRYAANRDEGIQRLKALCKKRLHLEPNLD